MEWSQTEQNRTKWNKLEQNRAELSSQREALLRAIPCSCLLVVMIPQPYCFMTTLLSFSIKKKKKPVKLFYNHALP